MKHIFLVLLLSFSIKIVAQNKLQYHLNVGDNFIITQTANQIIDQDINGVSQTIENNMTSKMAMEVIKVAPESYTISMTFKKLAMLMSSPTLGELSNVDSDTMDSTDVTSNMFKGILNIPVTIEMNKNGKIMSVIGGEKLIESMFSSANITQPEIIEASKGQLNKQFGSDALSKSLEQMTNFYPTKEVKIGDQWSNTFDGNLGAENTWTLEAYNAETIKITGISTTTMTNIDENVMMTLTGNQNTSITANTKTGLFSEIIVTSENQGDTLIQAQNMTIPTHIKSTITYKISK